MASVTLDFDAGHIGEPLDPDLDDRGRANVVIASSGSGEAVASDDDGPLGTTAIGTYRTKVDVNPECVSDLRQHANYHLALGTDPDPRYPQVTVDLDANPDLAEDVSAIDVGDLISLESLPEDLGQPTAELLALGYTEVIGSHRRVITFNTRQGAILTHVGMLDGDAEACLQTAGAELDTAITAEQVSFAVATTSGSRFTNSPPTGAKIIVGGREVMTVTAITGGSSPQTFTVTRDPDQRMAHADASEVKVYRALRLAL